VLKNLDHFSIPSKLALSSGVLVVALATIALVGVRGLNLAYSNFVEYRSLARQANADGRVQANIISTRVFARDFVIDPSDSIMSGVQERAAATIALGIMAG